MTCGTVKVPILGVLTGTAFLLSAVAAASPQIDIYLTAQADKGVPQHRPASSFDCTETVYGVLRMSGLEAARHRLDVVWRDPGGKSREHTSHEFLGSGAEQTLWVWLRMHRPAGAGLLRAFNPSVGMDDFIGEWSVKFAIDGRLVETKRFSVLC